MEDKIEVGEYYRTDNGKIYKWSKGRTYIGKNKIIKHSFDITDLIKTGDYVNEMLVIEVIKVEKFYNCPPHNIVLCNRDEKCTLAPLQIYKENIKSIVTKEQFDNIKYTL